MAPRSHGPYDQWPISEGASLWRSLVRLYLRGSKRERASGHPWEENT